METFKRDFQSMMRRFYCLLPVEIAFDVLDCVIVRLSVFNYISDSEFSYLRRLNEAYCDLLGGAYGDT